MKTIKKVSGSVASGSCLQGYVKTTYDKLVELIGDPNRGYSGDGKVTCEWVLDIDGTLVTIYDWKTGATPTKEYNWHVGGFSWRSVTELHEALGLKCAVA